MTDMVRTGTEIAFSDGSFPANCDDIREAASYMAKEYQEATSELRRLIGEINVQTMRIETSLSRAIDINKGYNHFEIDIKFDGKYVGGRYDSELKNLFDEYKRRAWRILTDHLGVRAVMSVAKARDFDKQLEGGNLPDITPESIIDVLLGLIGQSQDFAKDAAVEVFNILRPARTLDGQRHKTNISFRVGTKCVLTGWVKNRYGAAFQISDFRSKEAVALDGVFRVLDGKGVMQSKIDTLAQAISDAPTGRGETEYFAFKCFKNGNLHLTLKRLDLVKKLNGLAVGEYVLGPHGH